MEYVTFRGEKFRVVNGRLIIDFKDINSIAEIEGLEKLTNLEALELIGNNISDIIGLEKLRNLKTLQLINNKISEIKGLDNLVNLEELWLNKNEIREIKGLETLTKLKFLNLDNNNISKIEGLDTLIELKTLSLIENKIRGIKDFGAQSGYSGNAIPKIRGLRSLVNLEDFYLSGFFPDDRPEDLCRNFILKTYSASETIWWGIKHIIVNIYVPILIMLTFILIMFFLGIDPLSLVQNILFWIVLGVSLFFIVIYLIFMSKLKNIPRPLPFRYSLNEVKQEDKVTSGFVGDIMPTGHYDISFSQRVKNFFFNCDLIVGNLEGIMVEETSYERIGRRISTQKHELTTMRLLESLGKPPEEWLLCVSNNHSGDLGIEGFLEMLSILKGGEFNFFGNEDNPTFSWPTKKPIINFVAGTMWSNYRKCRFVSRFGCVSKYHDDNKFNILFPHWHYENEPYIRPFMGEKSRNFLKFGKYKKDKEIEKFYNNPASNPFQSGLNEWDFIFGHHSHTTQPA